MSRDGADQASEVPPALEARLGYLLGQAHLAHRRVAERRLASYGLRAKELGALSVLADEGPMSQQRLGERMGVDRTTMVAVVDGLQRAGLVERARDERDRRAYALRMTPRGRQLVRRATRAADRAEAEFLARLPPADRHALKRILRALVGP